MVLEHEMKASSAPWSTLASDVSSILSSDYVVQDLQGKPTPLRDPSRANAAELHQWAGFWSQRQSEGLVPLSFSRGKQTGRSNGDGGHPPPADDESMVPSEPEVEDENNPKIALSTARKRGSKRKNTIVDSDEEDDDGAHVDYSNNDIATEKQTSLLNDLLGVFGEAYRYIPSISEQLRLKAAVCSLSFH